MNWLRRKLSFIYKLLINEYGGTLSITRKTANTLATASGINTNYDEIEAVVNANIDADNLADDGVTAAKLHSGVVRTNYGLLQHTDGSLYVDVYGVLANAGTNGVEWGRAGDILLTSSATVPDGFSDITATYASKYIRVGATGLATGGSATHAHSHTHATGSFAGPSHTHTVPASSAVWGQTSGHGGGGYMITLAANENAAHANTDAATSASGTGAITGTSASDATTADTAPLYVDLKMYSKS